MTDKIKNVIEAARELLSILDREFMPHEAQKITDRLCNNIYVYEQALTAIDSEAEQPSGVLMPDKLAIQEAYKASSRDDVKHNLSYENEDWFEAGVHFCCNYNSAKAESKPDQSGEKTIDAVKWLSDNNSVDCIVNSRITPWMRTSDAMQLYASQQVAKATAEIEKLRDIITKSESVIAEFSDECEACGGDGKETCDNPDHGFISALSFTDMGRIGCPCCGHDPNHKVKNGGACDNCNGTGRVEKYNPEIERLKAENEDLKSRIPNADPAKRK